MNIIDIIKELITAWRIGGKLLRTIITLSTFFIALSILIVMIVDATMETGEAKAVIRLIAIILGIIGGICAFGVYAYRISIQEVKRAERIEQVERRVQEHPHETQAAWELARVKLESYLDRNLKQVRSIFWLTVFIMLVGFGLIGFGIFMVYKFPEKFSVSLISAISGIIINFIGATFIILYRSTMNQAKDYVTILERINAVGMSVQILDKLEDDETKLKQRATADIARELLALYSERKMKT